MDPWNVRICVCIAWQGEKKKKKKTEKYAITNSVTAFIIVSDAILNL
jgi:hypothetical protein